MAFFHFRCGERITLTNDNCTAIRNDTDFDHGLVISSEPLLNDILFEIKIDKKVNSWTGSLEIGVVDVDPLSIDFPPCASKIQKGSWIMSSSAFYKDGDCVIERYGTTDLEKLNQEDRVGVLRTVEGALVFYINGESQGIAAENLPSTVYAIVDLYGKCVQVTITHPVRLEYSNDDCLSGSSVLAIENDVLNVTLAGDLSELSMSSNSNSFDIRMDLNNSRCIGEETTIGRPPPMVPNLLRFHERCGTLVKLSNDGRSAERLRPLDEFNNGIVMTHRSLNDDELFEIRIDRLVEKWSGSIEMGITSHNPDTLVFPATMTNMRTGTIMMSGCGILTNGKGTRREYGDFNLDELSEGDRVGMVRGTNGDLHYYINGLDQGVAAQRVSKPVWGVIDLYGMTTKVSIVERDVREEQNLVVRRNTRDLNKFVGTTDDVSPGAEVPDYYDRLTFHPSCGAQAQVVNAGRTAHRPNGSDDFNNGVVLTARPLRPGEVFQVRLDRVVTKWAGSIEIGVTTHTPLDLEFPFTMTNVRSGTWMMTGTGIMHNGTNVLEHYGMNLDQLQVGDRVGVVRRENGTLHFLVNGVDQGVAAGNVPQNVYGVIDLYGQAVEATIMDLYEFASPDSNISSLSSSTIYSDLRFHHIHGKNVRIANNGLTAVRPRPLAEFNDAIVFSNRPIREDELFEIRLENIVDRWSGSVEFGVTTVNPEDVELPSTATDLRNDTWMLSGSTIIENGAIIVNNYNCDLDTVTTGVRLGVVVHSATRTIEFYCNNVPQGCACTLHPPVPPLYAVVDLYGQCAQISIGAPSSLESMPQMTIENRTVTPPTTIAISNRPPAILSPQIIIMENNSSSIERPLSPTITHHQLVSAPSSGAIVTNGGRVAKRTRNDIDNCLVYGTTALTIGEIFEVSILALNRYFAGSLEVGVCVRTPDSDVSTFDSYKVSELCWYLTGNVLKHKGEILRLFTPSLNWLNVGDRIGLLRTSDGYLHIYINSEELLTVKLSCHILTPVNVFFNINGSCYAIRVLSHQIPALKKSQQHQQQQTMAQSTTNIVVEDFDQSQVRYIEEFIVGKTLPKLLSSTNGKTYRFHENHGRNVELTDDKTVARRLASYNQGVVIVQPALHFGDGVTVKIEELDGKWQSSVIVGLFAVATLDRLNLPVTGLSIKPPCCILANDWINVNGVKTASECGYVLSKLTVGDTIGVNWSDTGCLDLVLNGEVIETVPTPFPTLIRQVYAVFDLYGQCKRVKIVDNIRLTINNDNTPTSSSTITITNRLSHQEKADLEYCEKETTPCGQLSQNSTNNSNNGGDGQSTKLTLPLPVPPIIPSTIRSTPGSPMRPLICDYRNQCELFKKSLLLPDAYFSTNSGVQCFCSGCGRLLRGVPTNNSTNGIEKIENMNESSDLNGWVQFLMKMPNNTGSGQFEKWLTAYWPTQVRNIRAVLDRGQPLTKGQSEWSTLMYRKEDDVQVVFYPSLENCTFPNQQLNVMVKVAFKLLIKPNAYSISRREPQIEWSTKESGAIILHSLLLQITKNSCDSSH